MVIFIFISLLKSNECKKFTRKGNELREMFLITRLNSVRFLSSNSVGVGLQVYWLSLLCDILQVILSKYFQFWIVTQIESCLNSRPLSPSSNDPHDLSGLTPSHVLHLSLPVEVTEFDLGNIDHNRLWRWRMQKFKQDFWKRWPKEYLSQLQSRIYWTSPAITSQEGQLM